MTLSFDPPVIAHRGASADAPENTMAAFTRAIQLGIEWVEFDVMLAACGTPIVFHDETLERTTNTTGFVKDHSYAYLRTLDAGSWFHASFAGERIPSLAQVAEFLADTGLHANVEIKPLPGQGEQTVIETLKVLSPFFDASSPSILFSSFSVPVLEFLRARAPRCHMGLLMHDWLPTWQASVDSLQCVSIHAENDMLTEERVKHLKCSGKELLSYTVNDIDRAEALFSWGVDAVFSDCPDQIARFS
tara:strand:- start:202 stop:939 length:738 start_codon:yes stop_codon:yes gene_type:complete